MRKLLILCLLPASVALLAQKPSYNPQSILFTIGNEPVTAGEFVKVYQKTSISGEADFSESSLREYLDLYVNFRLKVKEARELGMDTTAAVVNEFRTYRSKLTPSYMFDTSLLREAYQRMQKELRVEHVLVKLDPSATPADTLKAYRRAQNWRKLLTSGKMSFQTLAADSSQDPSAKDNNGDLGWITPMQLIYPFEAAAYSLKPGTISQPVRTAFGYHLIRVTDSRPSQGTVTVAHIFIKLQQKATEEDAQRAKQTIDSVYQALKAGADWDELVRKYSQDRTTVSSGGQLKPFGTGQMVTEFEQAAFALKNPGDYSQPVRTKFGWHIIKLINKKPLGDFNSVKDDIRKRIENGPWKDYAKERFITRLREQYTVKEFPANRQALFARLDSSLLKGMWSDSVAAAMKAPVFTITDTRWVPETKTFTQADLADFIEKNQRKFMNKGSLQAMYNALYDQFLNNSLTLFEDARLEAKNPPFRDLMEEYMNGILLFDLASDKVWTRAVEDTAGLRQFYEQNKMNYMGQEKAQVTVFTARNADVASQFQALKAKGLTDEKALAKINKKDKNNLTVSRETVERGKNSELEKLGWGTAGQTYTVPTDSVVRILRIDNILPPAPRPLNEIKGYVVADYQEMLEKEWVTELKRKYPVAINEQVFRSLIVAQ
ncbi:MAG: peptidylprolyl isomerase [Chitinophagales bacterium]|nr:peptidylprolyl isomerase [Chitinophagales bacterium]MDW8393897.1 peptidylprolyl isomerase [Chitinophagales bacterium]